MNSCVTQVLLILFVSLVLQQDVVSSKNNTTSTTTATSNVPTTATTRLSTTGNNTTVGKENPLKNSNDSGMLKRSLYVAIGLSALVAIYFIVRWVKTKGRRKAKKYGVIHGTGEMELQPLDKHIDEDEEDMTLFVMKDTKRPR